MSFFHQRLLRLGWPERFALGQNCFANRRIPADRTQESPFLSLVFTIRYLQNVPALLRYTCNRAAPGTRLVVLMTDS